MLVSNMVMLGFELPTNGSETVSTTSQPSILSSLSHGIRRIPLLDYEGSWFYDAHKAAAKSTDEVCALSQMDEIGSLEKALALNI